jgi:hypothetical protein
MSSSRTFSLFNPTPLVLAMALAFPLAHAAPTVEATGSFVDGSDYLSSAKSGAFTQPATDTPFGVQAYGAPISGIDSSTLIQASSDGAGHFATAISNKKLYGSFASMKASTQIVYSDSILNTSGTSQAVDLSLAINRVAFSIDNGAFDGLNRASFMAQVFVDGSSVALWSAGFAIDNPSNYSGPMAATTTGVDLGLGYALAANCGTAYTYCGSFGHAQFQSGPFAAVVNLGNVAAGDTLKVRYVVDLVTETNTYGGVASVSFDDPAGLSHGNGAALSFAATTPVPEPESAALLAVGLGLVASAARRRRRG